MKPICVKCQLFYRMKKGGYYFIEGMPKDGTRELFYGATNGHLWKPYKVWVGDLWQCRGCGAQIVSGVAHAPLSEHYMDNFDEVIKRTGADRLQVNDC